MNRPTALISGAGIAGLALASCLTRHHWEVTVVERTPALRSGGYKIDVRGAGVEVLQRMGLLAQAQRHALHMRGHHMVNRHGHVIAHMPSDDLQGRAAHDFELPRGALLQVLSEALGDRVNWVFNESITSLRDTGDAVQVTFRQHPATRYDLVVGADGIHSKVRDLAFGPEEPYLRPLGACIAAFPVQREAGLDQLEFTHLVGPGRVAMKYQVSGEPTATAMLLFRCAPLPTRPGQADDVKRQLRTVFADAGWCVPALLDELDGVASPYCDTMCQVHMPSWSTGRTVLIGDAAHAASPASGQGTSLGLVGAYLLAAALTSAEGNLPAAFARYEAGMRPFALANQKLAPSTLDGLLPKTRLAAVVQQLALRVMPHLPGREALIRRVIEPMQRAANDITLPDHRLLDTALPVDEHRSSRLSA